MMIAAYEKKVRGDPRLKPWATSPLYLLDFRRAKALSSLPKSKTLTFSADCKGRGRQASNAN